MPIILEEPLNGDLNRVSQLFNIPCIWSVYMVIPNLCSFIMMIILVLTHTKKLIHNHSTLRKALFVLDTFLREE